jgi:transposase-like protein
MAECGVRLDHATIQRWVVKYSPLLEEALHRRKRPVWVSWRLDETYIRVKGQWRYLYRAVDKYGQTIDFLLTEHRDKGAALRFLKKALRRNGVPETITIDGSGANEAAIKSSNEEHGTIMKIRQIQTLLTLKTACAMASLASFGGLGLNTATCHHVGGLYNVPVRDHRGLSTACDVILALTSEVRVPIRTAACPFRAEPCR